MKTIHLAPGIDTGLATLIDSRALVQANSGGGKSWVLRRMLEQSHGAVQQLVIDPEGEFPSLREKFDYVLAAKQGGDTAADPRSAGLLAQRLLELGASAILDLYELKAHERIRFVRLFLEALVDAPKKLWHPALIVLDEAHVFCPQQGEAESAGAVIDLCTRGRKRGFGPVLATQRLSKLHKDAAAELNNKLIGRTGLDVDVKRAADELGFGKERWRELRELEPGEFFVFGPALTREVRKAKIGPIQTTHPKAGSRLAFTVPPPTDRIKALLPKLSDLPAEQERKAKTEAELKGEVHRLKTQLSAAERRVPAPAPTPAPKVREVLVLRDAVAKRYERQAERLIEQIRALQPMQEEIRAGMRRITEQAIAAARPRPHLVPPVPAARPAPRQIAAAGGGRRTLQGDGNGQEKDLGRGELAILRAVAQHADAGVTREQLTVLTGYRRSTRDTYLQRLTFAGFVAQQGDRIGATGEGIEFLGADFEPLPTGDSLRAHWMQRLPEGEKKLLGLLIEGYPQPVEREKLSEATGYARSSRDTYLQRLSARRLVEPVGRGAVRASEILFSS